MKELKQKDRKIAVIGAGFAGISAASYLAKAGHQVEVFEKNAAIGGRARQLRTDQGYVFDMGPSWYWMPDVFEKFFSDFGYAASDFYTLEQLDPGFSIVYGDQDVMHIPANFDEICALFESIEKGSADQLRKFITEAAFKYEVGIGKLVYKPGLSLTEFFDAALIKGLFKLQVFKDFSSHVKQYFRHPKLIALMEFPVLFLGAMPEETPALYSLMNYAGLKLGTWYPKGGFGTVIDAMHKVAVAQGVTFRTNAEVSGFEIDRDQVVGLTVGDRRTAIDGLIASADYHHVEQVLLNEKHRNYSEKYWNKRTLAPSALIFYLGVKQKIDKLGHHTLFFDEDLKLHAREIYKTPTWPSRPLFYVCCPSATDDSVAPAGHENLFILMPLAPGINDDEATRESYFELLMERLEKYTNIDIRSQLDYKKSYCVSDFVNDYHSFKGNAYGLANTLMQTANLKPTMKNRHIKNFWYAGQLTVPGPGVPPSIISGKVAAQQLTHYLAKES